MRSPFPGMDPFIEDREWHDFHPTFNVAIAEALAPALEPRFVARVQRRRTGDQLEPSQELREIFLVIREVPNMETVTIIQTLSPANKHVSKADADQYLTNRHEVLQSGTNLIEIDLLRGGKRLSMLGTPSGDYCAIVSRGHQPPRADVFAWTIREPLPTIPIPLKKDELELSLDLQAVFTTVYDRARYHLSLNYAVNLSVPPSDADALWIREVLTLKPGY